MSRLHVLKEALTSPNGAVAFTAALAISIPVLAITSNVIILNPPGLNPIMELPKAALVGIIALLLSLNLAMISCNSTGTQSTKATGIMGGATAMLTSTCSVCQPVWLFWFGMGSASAFLADASVYIALASIVLLSFSLNKSIKSHNQCEVEKNGKNN